MCDPLSIVGGIGSILTIVSSVTKLSKSLNEIRESYGNVALNTTLVASQLATIRAALEALHAWRTSDANDSEASKQLDSDLGLSLSCCAILIKVIEGKLEESGYKPGGGVKQKIKYIWLEDILKEYVSNLEGQIRALQLLLTIFQCRTATEQKQQLAKVEARTIMEQVRSETMSLSMQDTERDDAISILSRDPSVRLDVESILMKSTAYKRVYGEYITTAQKNISEPSPTSFPRRKPVPKLSPSALISPTPGQITSSTKPLPCSPVKHATVSLRTDQKALDVANDMDSDVYLYLDTQPRKHDQTSDYDQTNSAAEVLMTSINQTLYLQGLIREQNEELKMITVERTRLDTQSEGYIQQLVDLSDREKQHQNKKSDFQNQLHANMQATVSQKKRWHAAQELNGRTTFSGKQLQQTTGVAMSNDVSVDEATLEDNEQAVLPPEPAQPNTIIARTRTSQELLSEARPTEKDPETHTSEHAESDLKHRPEISSSPEKVDASSSTSVPVTEPVTEASLTPAPPLSNNPGPSIPPIPFLGSLPTFDLPPSKSTIERSTVSSIPNSVVAELSSPSSTSDQPINLVNSSLQCPLSNATSTTSMSTEEPDATINDQFTVAKLGDDPTRLPSEAVAEEPTATDTRNLNHRPSFMRFSSRSSPSSALCDAAAKGDAPRVRALINGKTNVNAGNKASMTPMMLAAASGHREVLGILKRHGADQYAVDEKGRTVMHHAIANNQLLSLRWLFNNYPPGQVGQEKQRSSILAKAKGNFGARSPRNLVEMPDTEGSKPLHLAAEFSKNGLVRELLSSGASVNSRDSCGRTPLLRAIMLNRSDIFDTLCNVGPNIHVSDNESMSPLHWAAKVGNIDTVKCLLTKGANRGHFSNAGNMPIHEAALAGHVAVVDILIIASALERKELEIRTKTGETLLHIACLNKDVALAKYLLGKHVNTTAHATPRPPLLNPLSGSKIPLKSLTVLHYACCKGDFDMTLLLLENAARVNATTPDGVSALMMAAESENTDIVNLLISFGANVNTSIPYNRSTALHIASRRGDLETVQQLCLAGANPNHRSHSGSGHLGGPHGTPAEVADQKCTDEVKKKAIKDYFASLQVYDSGNLRPAPGISYAPWGQHRRGPDPAQLFGFPPRRRSSDVGVDSYASSSEQQQQTQQLQQWYDPSPNPNMQFQGYGESAPPPAYSARGAAVPAHLVAQAPLHRQIKGEPPRYA